MIWNVFFVVFAILVLAAIGLTVWFLKLGKRIFLLIPLLLLAGSVAYFAVYYTADNNFPPAQVMIASNFPSTVNSALVEESLQKADGNYTRTDEYDTGTVQYTLRLPSAPALSSCAPAASSRSFTYAPQAIPAMWSSPQTAKTTRCSSLL